MAGTKLISTRLTVCVACGHESRVVASTSDEVISRCYACGDVTRTPHRVQPAWSATASLRGHRVPPSEHPAPAEPLQTGAPDRLAG
jgi:hypothetical protein